MGDDCLECHAKDADLQRREKRIRELQGIVEKSEEDKKRLDGDRRTLQAKADELERVNQKNVEKLNNCVLRTEARRVAAKAVRKGCAIQKLMHVLENERFLDAKKKLFMMRLRMMRKETANTSANETGQESANNASGHVLFLRKEQLFLMQENQKLMQKIQELKNLRTVATNNASEAQQNFIEMDEDFLMKIFYTWHHFFKTRQKLDMMFAFTKMHENAIKKIITQQNSSASKTPIQQNFVQQKLKIQETEHKKSLALHIFASIIRVKQRSLMSNGFWRLSFLSSNFWLESGRGGGGEERRLPVRNMKNLSSKFDIRQIENLMEQEKDKSAQSPVLRDASKSNSPFYDNTQRLLPYPDISSIDANIPLGNKPPYFDSLPSVRRNLWK